MGGSYYDHEEFERNQRLLKEIFSPTLENSRKLYERQLLDEKEARHQAFLEQIAALREQPAQTLTEHIKKGTLHNACGRAESPRFQKPSRTVSTGPETLAPERP